MQSLPITGKRDAYKEKQSTSKPKEATSAHTCLPRSCDTTSSNQHLQIRGAFPGRFRGGWKIKKFVVESRLIPVAFMVMPGCVYSTIQFIFFLAFPYTEDGLIPPKLSVLSDSASHCIVFGIRCLRIRYRDREISDNRRGLALFGSSKKFSSRWRDICE